MELQGSKTATPVTHVKSTSFRESPRIRPAHQNHRLRQHRGRHCGKVPTEENINWNAYRFGEGVPAHWRQRGDPRTNRSWRFNRSRTEQDSPKARFRIIRRRHGCATCPNLVLYAPFSAKLRHSIFHFTQRNGLCWRLLNHSEGK
jgi:hypothetical protein